MIGRYSNLSNARRATYSTRLRNAASRRKPPHSPLKAHTLPAEHYHTYGELELSRYHRCLELKC